MEMPIFSVNGHADLFLQHARAVEKPTTPGERIRYARKLKRWNQNELERRTRGRIGQSSISDIETGATKEISGPNLVWLAAALNVRPEWIITGDEPMEPELSADELRLIRAYRMTQAPLSTISGNKDEVENVPGQLRAPRAERHRRKRG